MGYFIYNGINSKTYGILVTGTSVYGVPARDFTQVAVPGRNGDIIIDNGRYQNIDITYHCEINAQKFMGFKGKFEEFRRLITSTFGYHNLEDSYNPGFTRSAVISGAIIPKAMGLNWYGGSFDITFNCKPQMYITQGMQMVRYTSFTSGGIDDNGAEYDAYQVYIRTGSIPCKNVNEIKLVNHAESFQSADLTVHFYKGTRHVGKQIVTLKQEQSRTLTNVNDFDSVRIVTDWQHYMHQESQYYPFFDGYLTVIGDYEQGVFEGGSLIYNDTMYTSKPIMRFNNCYYGAKIKLGNYRIEYAGGSTNIIIDCEKQTAYTDKGKPIAITVTYADTGEYAEEFPSIVPGENELTMLDARNPDIQTNIWTL